MVVWVVGQRQEMARYSWLRLDFDHLLLTSPGATPPSHTSRGRRYTALTHVAWHVLIWCPCVSHAESWLSGACIL